MLRVENLTYAHPGQAAPYTFSFTAEAGEVTAISGPSGSGKSTLLDLLANRVPQVQVRVRERPIPHALIAGDYQNDRAVRIAFQQWLNGLWQDKDDDLTELLAESQATGADAV